MVSGKDGYGTVRIRCLMTGERISGRCAGLAGELLLWYHLCLFSFRKRKLYGTVLHHKGEKMKKLNSGIAMAVSMVFVLSTAVPSLADPPPWAPAHGRRAKSKTHVQYKQKQTYKYKYHYYPQSNVYFDTTRNLYFYLVNGQWVQAQSLPAGLKSGLGQSVTLEQFGNTPQQFHQEVTRLYSSRTDSSGQGAGSADAVQTSADGNLRTYLYYPDAGVYFDKAKELFFYQTSGNWQKAQTLPREIKDSLSEFVTVDLATTTPHELHQRVVTLYPGVAQSVVVQQQSGVSSSSSSGSSVVTQQMQGNLPSSAPSGSQTVTYEYQYRYYPDASVYFDEGRKQYFYNVNGQWEKAAALPGELQARLDEFVELDMNTEKPFQYHQEIRQTYPDSGAAGQVQTTTYHYQYYPSSSVYHDTARGLYFYQLNNQWQSVKSLPASLQINRNEAVRLDLQTAAPYTIHQEIIQKYPPGQAKKAIGYQQQIQVQQKAQIQEKVKVKVKQKGGHGKYKHKVKIKQKGKGKH